MDPNYSRGVAIGVRGSENTPPCKTASSGAGGPVTSPDFLRGQRALYSSIGAVCEGNTDAISARQVSSVGLISGGQQFFGGRQDPPEQTW